MARRTIGLQIDQLDAGYTKLIIEGMESFARERDANLLIFSGRTLRSPYGFEYQSNVVYDYISRSNVDALVLSTGTQCNFVTEGELADYLARFGDLPLVSLGIPLAGRPSVLADNSRGVREAVVHLARVHGLERIGFIKGPELNVEAVERFRSYRAAMAECGLEVDPELVVRGDFTAKGAARAVEEFLASGAFQRCQALIAANDESAIEAARVIFARGLRVPEDVALVGFDDIAAARYHVPPLTTVRQPLREQGRMAADFALRLLEGREAPSVQVLPTELMVRSTCGCFPRAVLEVGDVEERLAAEGAKDAAGLVELCMGSVAMAGAERAGLARCVDELEGMLACEGDETDEARSDRFIARLSQVLSAEIREGRPLEQWQRLLTAIFWRAARACGPGEGLAALFQKCRLLAGEMLALRHSRESSLLVDSIYDLRSGMERMISVVYIDELMEGLREELASLDVRSCFISYYDREVRHLRQLRWSIPEAAEVKLAYLDGLVVRMERAAKRYDPRARLLPPGLLPEDRRWMAVACPLYFREDQFGLIVFEPGRKDNVIYETFLAQLANTLKGSLLYSARQKAEEKLRQVLAELEEYNHRLSDLSQTDELTGLYNRRGFLNLGAQNLVLAQRMGKGGLVFFADLDGLKGINDTFGHQEGDCAIRAAGEALKRAFRNMDVIARLGGDEFVVLTVDTAAVFLPKIRARIDQYVADYNAAADKPYELSMSVGAVPFAKGDHVSLEALLESADEVLYEEKRRKRQAR